MTKHTGASLKILFSNHSQNANPFKLILSPEGDQILFVLPGIPLAYKDKVSDGILI